MGWKIRMQPWRVLKRQTKRDSLINLVLNSISFSVFNLVLKTTSLQLFSFLKLLETSIMVTSGWPIAEGSSNARFWPRKMGRRWLPSTQRKTLDGRHSWAVIAVEKATKANVLVFVHIFGCLADMLGKMPVLVENGISWATGLGTVPSQDATATMRGTGSCVSGAIRGGGFAGSTWKQRFQQRRKTILFFVSPNWTFRTPC